MCLIFVLAAAAHAVLEGSAVRHVLCRESIAAHQASGLAESNGRSDHGQLTFLHTGHEATEGFNVVQRLSAGELLHLCDFLRRDFVRDHGWEQAPLLH